MLKTLLPKAQYLLIPAYLLTMSGCAALFGTTYSEEYAEYPYEDEDVAVEEAPESAIAPFGEDPFAQTVSSRNLLKPLGSDGFSITESQESAESVFAETEEPVSTQDTAAPEQNPFALMAEDGFADSQAPEPQQMAQAPATAFIPAAATTPVSATAAAGSSATTFTPAAPRMPTPQEFCPPAATHTMAASPLVTAYPDEYIFDGGDRDHPVHYYGGTMAGLDTEDTIVEFKDNNGENHVKASNRVAVYAPRFGSVRTISGPDIGLKIDHAAGATDISGIDRLHERRGIDATVMNVPASGVATRAGASGVEIAQPAFMSKKADGVVMNNKVDQGFESKMSTGLNTLEISTMQELNLQIVEPASSKIKTGFGQTAATSQATQAYATFRAQSTVGTEEGGRKGEIHITKEASPLIAKPGDLITFKIHFRNIGDYNVTDVRIIDNLTPRLIYIQGTGQIAAPNDAGGALSVVPNKEGSQMLEFRLDEPLAGGKSGSITFQARVR